jgi:hypothetical protein
MQVLVATTATQGARPSDRAAAGCGCRRVMIGVDSGQPTTTFAVADRPDLDQDAFRRAIFDSLDREGAVRAGDCGSEAFVAEMAADLAEVAAGLPAGTVLERRGPAFWPRQGVQSTLVSGRRAGGAELTGRTVLMSP